MKAFTARKIPRRRGAITGVLLVILGLWGALVPFVGPYFNYQIGTTATWDWSAERLWLSVLPGAAAVLGGLIMLYSVRRASASFGALLALAGGLWFVVGPTLSMLWNHGVIATGTAFGANGTRVLEWVGFFYGSGALITVLASYGLGFLSALPVTGEALPAGTAVAAPPRDASPTSGGEAPAAEPAGGRRILPRRRLVSRR